MTEILGISAKALTRRVSSVILSILLILSAFPAQAVSPEESAVMVRFSLMFESNGKPIEPWVGMNFSHNDKAMEWEKERERPAETSVSFNLTAPEMALASQQDRTVIPLGESGQTKVMVGCGGPDPEPSKKDNDASKYVIGGAVVVSVVTYLLATEEVVLHGC